MKLLRIIVTSSILFASINEANAQSVTSENLVNIHNLNTTQIGGLVSPSTGSLVYNTDSNKLFVFNGTIWMATATVDTTNLSNRINQRVRYSDTAAMLIGYVRKADTAAMLNPYLRKADTASLSTRINARVRYTDTAVMLTNYATKANLKDTATVLRGLINSSVVDTSSLSTRINARVKYTDTAAMLIPYARTAKVLLDSTALAANINTRVRYTDTAAMLTNYATKANLKDTATVLRGLINSSIIDTTSLSNRIEQRVKYTDTASILAGYIRKSKFQTDSTMFQGILNAKVNYSDTASMLTNYVTNANNGLTKTGKNIQLGGNLTAPTTITNSGANTFRIGGLANGDLNDSLVVADPGTGELMRISANRIGKADSTTASNGLTLTGKDVRLGGNLSAATTITNSGNALTIASGGSAVNITGLTSGALTDSVLTINTSTGRVNRINSAQLNKADSTSASNGLTLTGKDVRLGGTLSSATTITNSGANTLRISGLSSGDLNDSLVVADPTTGELLRVSSSRLSKADSTTASNGLTLTGKDVRLGGSLNVATNITTTAANTLAVSGLQSGTTNDSLVVADASTGVLKRIASSRVNRADSTTASNGLTLSAKDVRLGGALNSATTITTTGTNTLSLSGLQSGSANDSIIVADASSGLLKRISSNRIVSGWSLTGNSGTVAGTNFIGTTDGIDLVFKVNNVESGRLNLYNLSTSYGYNSVAAYKSTSIGYGATTGSNTEAVSIGNASASAYRGVSVGSEATTNANNSVALGQASTASYQATALGSTASATGNNSTAIGFGATTSQANALILGNSSAQVGIGTSTPGYALDVNATTNPLKLSGLASGALTDSVLTINTSGVVRRVASSLVNKADSTTASNGLTLTGKDVRLGGTLTSATTITNSGANTLRISGLANGDLNDSLVVADPTSGELFRVSSARLTRADSTTASNGLTLTGKDVRLGGSLNAATNLTTTAANTLAVSGLQSGTTNDSIVVADASTGVLKRIASSRVNRADSTTASNGLTLTGKDIRLGGTLTSATTITNSGANTLRISGLANGDLNDSLVVADPTSGELFRVSSARLTRADSTTASNGLTITGKDVRLGGTLTSATTITNSGANTLRISGLANGDLNDSLVVADPTSGELFRVSSTRLTRADSTTASNGLTLTGKDVRLGGSLTVATTITTNATNTLSIAGLQTSSLNDSILMLSSGNVVRRINSSSVALEPFNVLGGSTKASTNTQNIYTQGDLSVGKTTSVATLDVGGKIKADSNISAPNFSSTYQNFGSTGGAITWNMQSGATAGITLTSNTTLTMSNVSAGMYGLIRVTQDGTGGRTLTLPAGSRVINSGGSSTVVLTQTASAVDILTFFYDGTNYWWTIGNNY